MIKRPPLLIAILLEIVGIVFLVLLYNVDGAGFSGKTLWDWMNLFIVPLILAVGGIAINSTIQSAEQKRTEERERREKEQTEKRAEVDREQAEKRAEVDHQIADDRLKEQALQTYLDRMSELLLSGQYNKPDTSNEARTVAKARTLTILRGLDSGRKAALIRFLSEAGLINGEHTAALDLSTSNLEKIVLTRVQLNNASLKEVNLQEANLEEANLEKANLERANLERANLFRVNLRGANLEEANLKGVNLRGAHLERANLRRANLEGADLGMAHLENAYLESANLNKGELLDSSLKRANLNGAKFERSNLSGANLEGASMFDVYLGKAYLWAANLKDTVGVTTEQLETSFLNEYTILSDGSHYKPPQDSEPPKRNRRASL